MIVMMMMMMIRDVRIRLDYSVELLIEYLSTRPIPEVAIIYRVAQKQTAIWFLVQVSNTITV